MLQPSLKNSAAKNVNLGSSIIVFAAVVPLMPLLTVNLVLMYTCLLWQMQLLTLPLLFLLLRACLQQSKRNYQLHKKSPFAGFSVLFLVS